MRFLKRLFLGLVVLVLIAAVVGLFLPASAHVERSTTINAAPEAIFPLVNDFHRFQEWSPWAKIDPNAKTTLEGPDSGVGAKMSWHSDDPNVGSGSQEILESDPPTDVKVALDFGDKGKAVAFYRLEAQGSATKITWGFDAPFGYNLLGRYFGLMFDKWIGPDYEKGLASLKALVESQPHSG
jgi:uncharacterized protein YndB with AHSA1/START domain